MDHPNTYLTAITSHPEGRSRWCVVYVVLKQVNRIVSIPCMFVLFGIIFWGQKMVLKLTTLEFSHTIRVCLGWLRIGAIFWPHILGPNKCSKISVCYTCCHYQLEKSDLMLWGDHIMLMNVQCWLLNIASVCNGQRQSHVSEGKCFVEHAMFAPRLIQVCLVLAVTISRWTIQIG